MSGDCVFVTAYERSRRLAGIRGQKDGHVYGHVAPASSLPAPRTILRCGTGTTSKEKLS